MPQGIIGPTGADGATGPAGADGATGPAGADGAAATIAVGTVVTGPAGSEPEITNAGTDTNAIFNFVIPQGPTGADGATGPAGADGATGPAGADGATGPAGADGATGPAGADGAAATITVGTVATGPAGSEPQITNAGTDTNAIFNFVIPQGPTGADGATGPAGADGATGPAGADGATGPAGADGAAATIAVGTVTTGPAGSEPEVTNSGTDTDAIFNFVIPQGPTGPTGTAGAGGTIIIPFAAKNALGLSVTGERPNRGYGISFGQIMNNDPFSVTGATFTLTQVDQEMDFVTPRDLRLIAIAASFSNYSARSALTYDVVPFIEIATAPVATDSSLTYTLLPQTITEADPGFLAGVSYPINAAVAGYNGTIDTVIPANTRVYIVGSVRLPGNTGSVTISNYYNGSLLFEPYDGD